MSEIELVFAICIPALSIGVALLAWSGSNKFLQEWKLSFCERLLELADYDNLAIDYETAMDKAGQYIEHFSDWAWTLPEEAAEQEYEAIIGSL